MLEESPKFALKTVILRIILVIIALFILVWLFPTKQYVTNQIDKSINKKLDGIGTSYNGVFNENVKIMKDGATSYFTSDRLPKNTGDTVTLTLKEMLDRHLIIEFTDGNGETCDPKDSYVEVTKEDSEYIMKVNLSCDKQKDYVLVHMGDYDYCTTAICEKKKIISENDTNNSTKTCEYVKYTGGTWSDYGAWSAWTTSKINKNNYTDVQTKVVKTGSATSVPVKSVVTKAATKSTRTTYTCPSGYSKSGSKCIKTAAPTAETKQRTTGGKTYTQTVYICSSLYDNEGRYSYYVACKKTVNASASVKNTYTCPNEYDNKGTYSSPVTCRKTQTTYKNVSNTKDVTYYRSRTKTCKDCKKDTKWSNCNDSALINSGYSKTGNTK